MKKLKAKIIITRLLMVAVILVGLQVSAIIAKPLAIELYGKITRDTHLAGEVYTAKDLNVTIEPIRMYYDSWSVPNVYEGDFVNDDYHFKHGIGWYIPGQKIREGDAGATQLGFWLGGEFDEVYFKACTDTLWTAGYEAGTYRIICYVDGAVVCDTGFNDYTYSEKIKFSVEGAEELIIELQETKGTQDTLNVILGEFEVNKLND